MKFFFLIAIVALMQPMLSSCDKDEQQDIVIESVAEQNAKKIESYNKKEAQFYGVSIGSPSETHKFRVESPFIIIRDNDNSADIYINLVNLKSMSMVYNYLELRF